MTARRWCSAALFTLLCVGGTACGAAPEAGSGVAASSSSAASSPVSSSAAAEETLQPGLEGFCHKFIVERPAEQANEDIAELTRLVPPDLSAAMTEYASGDPKRVFPADTDIATACAGQGPATVEMTISGGEDDAAVVVVKGGYCGTNAEGFVYSYLGQPDSTSDPSTEPFSGHLILEAPDAEPGQKAKMEVSSALTNVGLSNLTDYLGSTKEPGTMTLNENGTGGTFAFEQYALAVDPQPTVDGTLTCS